MGGILARPSWLVRVSHVFKIFLPNFALARPFTNLTITLARSTGFPLGVLTSTINVVMSAAARRLAPIMTINPAINRNRFRMSPIIPEIRPGSGDVRQKKLPRLARGSAYLFRGAITAAHRALHRGRPAGACPVACQENIGSVGLRIRPQCLHAGPRGIGGAYLLDYLRPLHLGLAHSRKEFRSFPQRQFYHFGTRHLHQVPRSAHHELQVPALAFV